jgi:ribosome modulation factor
MTDPKQSKYRDQGARAFGKGESRDSCRYKAADIVSEWQAGWDDAQAVRFERSERDAEKQRREAIRAANSDPSKWYKIPQFPRAHYEVDVGWDYLEDALASWAKRIDGKGGLDMSPEYQRGHVWTRDQQIAYVEYVLAGGEIGRNITWNSPDWMRSWEHPTELVDGKQRIEAVRSFLRGEFAAYGKLSEPGDRFDHQCSFRFRVCSLTERADILRLYLNINAGGTPHTAEEIDRVRAMLSAEVRS